jgi:hypothetical protein
MRKWVLLWVCLSLLGGATVLAQDMPTRSELDEGWTVIAPGGDTLCARGTPYYFFVREGSSERLLIEFQGGGACWNGLTCGVMSTFNDSVAPDVTAHNPVVPTGIHDFDNPDNPFADYDVVFVPYCTGDVHMGNSVVTYEVGAETYEIHFNGNTNASAALDWTYTNFSDPEAVFITGCSAGALGSSFHAPSIMAHYTGVPAVQLGDAAGGYRGDLTRQVETWGTASVLPDLSAFEGMTAADLDFSQFYIFAGETFPQNQFAQSNTSADEVQSTFITLGGTGEPFDIALSANLGAIDRALDNFASYTAWGSEHCILPHPTFYTYQVNGVRFRDWVAALEAGEDVETVTCADCETPEYYTGE